MTAFGNAGIALVAMAMASNKAPSAPTVETSADLIDACRRGDRTALDQVFRAHADVLERLLARLLGPRGDVEDALQETFVAAMQAFPRFRGEASVRSWLHRIAIHVAHKELRRPRHRRETALVADVPADVASTTERMAESELAHALYAHLDKLEARKRIAIILHVIEGYSVAEIAALTGASATATKSRLFWARRALLASIQRDPALRDARGER